MITVTFFKKSMNMIAITTERAVILWLKLTTTIYFGLTVKKLISYIRIENRSNMKTERFLSKKYTK